MTADPVRRVIGHWRRRTAQRKLPPLRQPVADPTHDVTIGAILDEFSWSCLAPEARLVELDPMIWRRQLERDHVDLIFVESAWAGNQGRWRYALAHWPLQQPNRLAELVAWASKRGIPTVFWNKEDPVNFDEFIDAAAAFSHVFTTDAETVDRYRSACGHDRIGVLPFAAQPLLHNPIGRTEGRDRIAFAGAWRAAKYPHRAAEFDRVLRPAFEQGALDIFDRYADDPQQRFPDRYRSACLPALPYDQMTDTYRRYAAFVNVNSVNDSPTMFSRRVFEILACGVPVISTPSVGITALLGDHVISVHDEAEARDAVALVLDDPDERDRRAFEAYRHVHLHHTYRRRLATVLEAVGLADRIAPPDVVQLSALAHDDSAIERLAALAEQQTAADIHVTVDARRPPAPQRPTPHIAAVDPGVRYPDGHGADAVIALRYSPEDGVGVPAGRGRSWSTFGTTDDALAGSVVMRPGRSLDSSGVRRIHSPAEQWRR